MTIRLELEEDDALDMLMGRLNFWTDDEEVKDLYREMYSSYVNGGVFEGSELNVRSIVDNDYVNWCSTLYQEDCSEEDWKKLVELYEEGTRDISCEEFDENHGDFIEAMNTDRTMALMR